MPTSFIERETTITYNEAEGEAMVWPASPVFQRKMERLGIPHYKSGKRDGIGVEESRYYKVPKAYVRIVLPRRLTEEQRNALRERARVRFSGDRPKPQSNGKGARGEIGTSDRGGQ